jgi:D-glycero-alpha-D-manno-heptose-7-phosphate kinase
LRISFAGGGTDVSPFPELEGGCVLSATITVTRGERCAGESMADLHQLTRFRDVAQLQLIDDLVYDGEMDLPKGAIQPAGRRSWRRSTTCSCTRMRRPARVWGSSSAMMVALVGLLKEMNGQALTDYEVADLAYDIERVDLGILGACRTVRGGLRGFNFIEFLADRVVVQPLKIKRRHAERARIQHAAVRYRQGAAVVAHHRGPGPALSGTRCRYHDGAARSSRR